jgi:hypothetical protein
MGFVTRAEYFAQRAAACRAAGLAASDPVLAFAHDKAARSYEAVCARLATNAREAECMTLGDPVLSDGRTSA